MLIKVLILGNDSYAKDCKAPLPAGNTAGGAGAVRKPKSCYSCKEVGHVSYIPQYQNSHPSSNEYHTNADLIGGVYLIIVKTDRKGLSQSSS